MDYLKYSDLRDSVFRKAHVINESKNFSGLTTDKIFLSYSHQDKDEVVPIVNWLQSLGVNVYIDYLDDELQGKSDVEAARILRLRIGLAKKLILLASVNIKGSKWVPWELGVGDGELTYPNVIRLPITYTGATWMAKDYYDIYGYVGKSTDNIYYNEWIIKYPNPKLPDVKLKDWLRS